MSINDVLTTVLLDVASAWNYHQTNLERCRQAVMHSSLRKHLGTFAWQIVIELEMLLEGVGKKYPDLVDAKNGVDQA